MDDPQCEENALPAMVCYMNNKSNIKINHTYTFTFKINHIYKCYITSCSER